MKGRNTWVMILMNMFGALVSLCNFVDGTAIYTHALSFIFFGVSSAGTAHGLKLSRMKPLSSNIWICCWNSLYSVGLIRYVGMLGRVALSIRSTACWMSRMDGSVGGNSSRVIYANSLRIVLISVGIVFPFDGSVLGLPTSVKMTLLSQIIAVNFQRVMTRSYVSSTSKSWIHSGCKTTLRVPK